MKVRLPCSSSRKASGEAVGSAEEGKLLPLCPNEDPFSWFSDSKRSLRLDETPALLSSRGRAENFSFVEKILVSE